MIKTQRKVNIKRLSIILLYVAILVISLSMLPIALIARGGTVDDAIKLKSEWAAIETAYTPNTLITDSMETVYNAFISDKSGDTLTKYTSVGTGKNGIYNYVITINTPRDLMMFSYAAFGSHYGGGDSLTKLQAFVLKANFTMTQNIDYTALKTQRTFREYGSAKTAILYGTQDNTKTYSTNALYEGYSVPIAGQAAPLVPKMFVPVSSFEGVFNGQNFIIRNLKISSSEIATSRTQDAMFESINVGGYVHSFGLVDSQIIGSAAAKKATSLVVGTNAGTVEYVYSLGAIVTNSSSTAFKVVLTNTGTAAGYYSAKTVLDTVSLNDFNSSYADFTALCADARYHYDNETRAHTVGTSVLPSFFTAKFLNGTFTYPNLFGLRRATESGTNIKTVSTVADFLGLIQTIHENNRDHVIKLSNSLDFTFVNEYAIVPAVSVFAANVPDVKIYSGTINTTGNTLATNVTIKNLHIKAYVAYGTTAPQYVMTAIFGEASLTVHNVNFLGCSAYSGEFSTDFIKIKGVIVAGLLVGTSTQIDLANIGSNANVTLADGADLGGEVNVGGLVGMQSNNLAVKTKRVAVTGNVIAGDGNTNTSDQNKPYSVGGVFGQVASNQQNHDTVYVGANVRGIRPTKRKSNDQTFFACTGGFAGKASIFGSEISGIYADGTVTNFNNSEISSDLTSESFYYLGGIIGRNDETNSGTGFISPGVSIKFNGTLNISQQVGQNVGKTVARVMVGAIAGASGDGLYGFSVSSVVGNDVNFNLNYSTAYDKTFVYVGSVLGHLFSNGYVGKDALGVSIDRAFAFAAPGGNISVGGVYGLGEARASVKNVTTTAAAAISLTVASGSGLCKANGVGETGNFSNINFGGSVFIEHKGSGATLHAAGVGYTGDYTNVTILAEAKINAVSANNTNTIVMAGMMSAYTLNGTNTIITGCYNYANLVVPLAGKDVYVAGLAGRPFSLQSSTNYGTITGTTTANNLYVAGVALMGGGINAPGAQRTMRFAVNQGNINIVAGSVETFFQIGGVLLQSESTSTYDGLINKGNITFTGTTSGDKGTAQLLLGGIVANETGSLNISHAFNSGNIVVTNFTNSYITVAEKKRGTYSAVGGIVGGANQPSFTGGGGVNGNTIISTSTNIGNITVEGVKNTAVLDEPKAAINERFLNVGGIIGLALTYNNSYTITDSVNSGNITSFGRSGGIVGTHANSHGGAFYSNFKGLLNYGDIVGQTAGGIFASVDISRYNINGAINYGNINMTGAPIASFAGGIAGAMVASASSTNVEDPILTNAVNYGNVGKTSGNVVLESGATAAASSGGIVGAVTRWSMGFGSSVFRKLENLIHFDGIGANSNPRLFGNSGTTDITTLAVGAKTFISVADDTVTSNIGVTYYANTSSAATASKKWVYADDFMWGLDNETQDLATLKDSGSMFVWSEKAYKNKTDGKYHTDKITDASPYCFALTGDKGRVVGVYLGELDYSYLFSLTPSNYDFLKQIEYSRDLFSRNIYGIPPILRDTTRINSGDAFADIGVSAYSEKVEGTGAMRKWDGSFTTVFDKAFPFFTNNIKDTGSFTLDGANIGLKPAYAGGSYYFGVFSSNVNIPEWKDVPFSTAVTFNSDTTDAFQKVMEKTITIYQGTLKTLSDFATQADYDRYKRLYTRDYTFRVIFYDQSKTFELISTSDKQPKLTALDATGKIEVGTNLDATVDKITGDVKEYAFEKTQGASDVEVKWEKGVFTANFLAQGFSRAVLISNDRVSLTGNGRTIGQYIAPDSEKGIVEVAGGYHVKIESSIVTEETFEFEGVQIAVNVYEIKLTITITDKSILQEIEGGSYRLSYSVASDTSTLQRVFTFAKEKTGDVFLRYNASGTTHNSRLAAGKTPENTNVTVSQFLHYYGADSRAKTAITRNTSGLNYTQEDSRARVVNSGVTSDIINFRPLNIQMNEVDALINNRSGAFPDFFTPGKSVMENPLNLFSILRGFIGNAYSTEAVAFSKPKITVLTPKNVKGEYTGIVTYTYSFSVFAPNGNEGRYSINFVNTAPNTGTTTLTEGALTGGIGIVGRGETKSFKLDSNFKSEGTIVLDYSIPKAEIYVATERDGTTLKEEKLIAIYNYNTTPTETDDFEIIDPSYILPKVAVLSTAEGGVSVRFTYQNSTSGGIFRIRPLAKYSHDITLPNDLELTVTDGVAAAEKVSKFVFPSFNYYELIVEKTASTKRHISDMDFSSSPDSGVVQYYVSNTPSAVDGAFGVDGNTGKAKVSYSMFPSGVDMNRLRLVVKYAAADYDLDYNTDIVFELYGEGFYTGATAQSDYSSSFIDEYARIFYVEKGAVTTELKKEIEYTDSTNTVIKVVRYFMHLPESQSFQLRVLAENPSFYCDYQILSDGTPRNKTFNVEVNSPSGHEGLFTVSLKTQIKGVFTRTTNLLYVVSETSSLSHYYAKKRADGSFFNNYISTLNMSATYVLSVSSPDNNVKILVNSITTDSSADSARLSVDIAAGSFFITGDDPLIVNVKITLVIDENYKPPWGATGKG